jgi:MFS family permease
MAMDRREKKIMGLTTSAHGLVHFYEGVLPPLIPLLLAEFNTDYFHMGIIVSVFSYAFGLGSLPAGILADKFGPRRLVTLFLFGAGLFCVAIWPVGSLWSYGLLMGLVGACCSTYHPASNTLISIGVREKGKAFGIHGIAGSLGVALAPILSAGLGSAMGWRTPHVIYGILGIAIGVYSLSIPRPPKPQKTIGGSGKGEKPNMGTTILSLVVFFMSATALGLTYKGIMTFLPVYMGESVHLSFLKMNAVTLGGTVATLALLSGAVGQYVAGRLVDVYAAEKLYLIAILVGTVFVFIMAAGSGIVIVLAAVVYAFFYFSTQPLQNYMISRYLPRHRQGFGYGLHFFLSFGIGSTAAVICGWIADNLGLSAVFYSMGCCFAASAILATILVVRSKIKPVVAADKA